MSPTTTESAIAVDFSPVIRVYEDGRVERPLGGASVPPSLDPTTGVVSKDVLYSPEFNISVRIYIPEKTLNSDGKLPVVVYFHGGGFVVESASSPVYHNYLNSLVGQANCVAVSVDYRLAPENPIPAAFEDSWAAIQWVASHLGGSGPEEWLNKYGDLKKVFLAGDSAGGLITHHMAMKEGEEKLEEGCVGIAGIILVHPMFWDKNLKDEEASTKLFSEWLRESALNEKDGAKDGLSVKDYVEGLWKLANPNSTNPLDDWITVDPSSLVRLQCKKVLMFLAETDFLVRQYRRHAEKLKTSGWKGTLETMETKGEGHVFHLGNPTSEKAGAMLKKMVEFINN